MGEKVKISELKDLAKAHGYDHVICFATKGKTEFVATYGATVEQCDQAAQFGDKLKDGLGWPESLHAMPSRVKQLKNRAEKAEAKIENVVEMINNLLGEWVSVQMFYLPEDMKTLRELKESLLENDQEGK